MNILFTCAGRRNYLIDYFKEALNGEGKVVVADMQKSAPAMASADVGYVVPEVYSNNYIDTLIDICNKENVKAIFSLNDLELPILAQKKEVFSSHGVKVIVSSPTIIDTCFDKWKTNKFAESIGLNVPKTYLSIERAKQAIESGEVNFPLVIKPRWGSASIGIEFPLNLEELELSFKLLRKKVERSILGRASSSDIENSIMIQEKISGKEFGLDILNDLEGNNIVVYVKEKLAMRAGETDKAVLVNIPVVEAMGQSIGLNLRHIGNLDCDIMENEGKYYFLEMNPRFGGGYPFTHLTGGNFPLALIKLLKGETLNESLFVKKYGQAFSKADRLIPIKLL
ncbi:MAG TPA: ATP-grasp domain-containing protein [Tenuifilaceae bacterium]|nr:ATP-grasp domain-containing protein [Tenuifilaceae bacterium]